MGDGFFIYKNITATGVSTISISQYGLLHSVVLNQYSTAAAVMTIYDATTTSGSPPIIGTPNLIGAQSTDYVYDCEYANGLTVNIAAGATPCNITIIYR